MGCGKLRGFQLVIDSQKVNSLPKSNLPKGFKVFVTIPGVVTSKVSLTSLLELNWNNADSKICYQKIDFQRKRTAFLWGISFHF